MLLFFNHQPRIWFLEKEYQRLKLRGVGLVTLGVLQQQLPTLEEVELERSLVCKMHLMCTDKFGKKPLKY